MRNSEASLRRQVVQSCEADLTRGTLSAVRPPDGTFWAKGQRPQGPQRPPASAPCERVLGAGPPCVGVSTELTTRAQLQRPVRHSRQLHRSTLLDRWSMPGIEREDEDPVAVASCSGGAFVFTTSARCWCRWPRIGIADTSSGSIGPPKCSASNCLPESAQRGPPGGDSDRPRPDPLPAYLVPNRASHSVQQRDTEGHEDTWSGTASGPGSHPRRRHGVG